MNAFWFVIGMLSTLAVLAVILPWLRTIPKLNSLPALPWQAPLVAVAIIGASLGMYAWLGRPDLISTPKTRITADTAATSLATSSDRAASSSMGSAIASLRARLKQGGGSADDWELLAKSYDFLGRPDAAAAARKHQLATDDSEPPAASAAPSTRAPTLSTQSQELLRKAGQLRADKQFAAAVTIYKQLAAAKEMNADSWADYADSLGSLRGGKLAGEPESLIGNALALEPAHAKALWLKASADEEAGRHAQAIESWQRLLAVLPADSADAKVVSENLRHERELAGVAQQDAPTAAGVSTALGAPSIQGEVSIASALRSRAAPGATLFIVAKSMDAPGPPVAVYRGSVADWPVKFLLNDSSSMVPGRNLSNAKRVTVEARISASGQAMPSAGDLRGSSGVVDPSSHQMLKIVINEVVS